MVNLCVIYAINYRFLGYLQNAIIMCRILLKELSFQEGSWDVRKSRREMHTLIPWLLLQLIKIMSD